MEIPFTNHPFNIRYALSQILNLVRPGALAHKGNKDTYDYVQGENHDFSHFNIDHNLANLATILCVIMPFKYLGLAVILYKIIRTIEKLSGFWEEALWWKWEKKHDDYYGMKKFWKGTKKLLPDIIKYARARGQYEHCESMKKVARQTQEMNDNFNGLVKFLSKDSNLTHGRLCDSAPHQLELAFTDTMFTAQSFKRYLNGFYVKSALMEVSNEADAYSLKMDAQREKIYDSWLKVLITTLGGTYEAFDFQAAKKLHFESEQLKTNSRKKEGKVSGKQKKYIDQIGKFEKFIHILENANEFKLHFNQQ